MSQFRYILGTSLINEAVGWDKFVTTIKRNRSSRGLEVTQDATLTFTGATYDMLYNLKQTEGFDYTLPLVIRRSEDEGNTWNDWLEGTIFLSDLEWDEEQKTVTTKIVDRGYFARINNNKKLKIPMYAEFSKNNVAITPCPATNLKLFKPANGTYYTITQPVAGPYSFKCFKVYDAMEFMIRWMTDGQVGFESTSLQDGGEYGYYVITTGRVLQNGDPNIVYSPPITYPGVTLDQWQKSWQDSITFEDALDNLCKRFNLIWSMVYSNGGLKLKLETEQYWRDNINLFLADNIAGLKCRTNAELLYGAVAFGQGEVDNDTYLSFPESIEFIGFKDEELPVVGESNVADNTLNLKTKWISSSNVIEAMLVNGLETDRSFDPKVFIIQCQDNAGVMEAVPINNLDSSAVRFYNQGITNSEISKRYLGSVPNSLAVYLGTETGYFVARRTSIGPRTGISSLIPYTSIIGGNITFENDYEIASYEEPQLFAGSLITNSGDPNGVYGGAIAQGNPVNMANSYFTAPVSGRFGFSSSYVFLWEPDENLSGIPPSLPNIISLHAWITDNSGTYLYDIPMGSVNAVSGFNSITGSCYLNLNSGERVYVYRHYRLINMTTPTRGNHFYTAFNNSFFACTSVASGGGIYQQYDPTQISIFNYEFETPMTESQFNTILSSKRGTIQFRRNGGKLRSGWVEQIKYNHYTNQANLIVASKEP